jgi:hypothetical protein
MYDESIVLDTMRMWFGVLGSTPSSKIDNRLCNAAVRFFGTWDKAVVAAGLEPNTQWVIRRQIPCRDGHVADSISEKIVDDWLSEHGVAHERHKAYPEGRYTCDFYLPEHDVWVEYFGLYGEHRDYDSSVETKRDIARRHKLRLIELFPKNLFPTKDLGHVLNSIGSRVS